MGLSPSMAAPLRLTPGAACFFGSLRKKSEGSQREKIRPDISKKFWIEWKKIHSMSGKFGLYAREKTAKKTMQFFHELIQPINGKLVNQQKIEIEHK